MTSISAPFALLTIVFVFLFLLIEAGYSQDSREADKIQYLISSVETLKGAKFIRNGKTYDARRAGDHLRLKLKAAGDQIKTAEDFIRLCASKSSVSGEPYLIRFSDGSTKKAEVYFRNRLREFPEKGRP
ncbi:MAG: DUF5329 family protein [Deltaproteobacteria bacterium]|nr:DUF5329 family protein [Deltaproteobacteria bacterium]